MPQSFARHYSGINLKVDEQPEIMVEDQDIRIKKLNNEQPVVKKTIITPKVEKKNEADTYLQYNNNEFINIDAPIKKMINIRRD